jgi:hypothetical protein
MGISQQLWHLLATMDADADKCYDRINHNIMSFLLLAMVGTMGPIVAMLHPIQAMKSYQKYDQRRLDHIHGRERKG